MEYASARPQQRISKKFKSVADITNFFAAFLAAPFWIFFHFYTLVHKNKPNNTLNQTCGSTAYFMAGILAAGWLAPRWASKRQPS